LSQQFEKDTDRRAKSLQKKVAWSSVQNRFPAVLIEDFLAFPHIIRADMQSNCLKSRTVCAAAFQANRSSPYHSTSYNLIY
jgi:hypothetical protein